MADGYPTTPARSQNAGDGLDNRRAAPSARMFQRADCEVGLLEQDAAQPILATLQLQGFDAQQLVDHLWAKGSSESPESGNIQVRLLSASGGRDLGQTGDHKLAGAVRFAALTCTSLVPSDEDVFEIVLRAGPQLLAVRHLKRQALIDAWAKGRAASESDAGGSTGSKAYPVSISMSCADAALAAHGDFVAAAARGDAGAIAFSSPTPQRASELATAGSRPTTADLPEGGSDSGRQQRVVQASGAVLLAEPAAADAVALLLSVSIGFCSAGVLQLSVAAVKGLRPINVLHRSRCAVALRVAGKAVKSALSAEPLPTATFAADSSSSGGLTLWLDARDYANDAQITVVDEEGTELASTSLPLSELAGTFTSPSPVTLQLLPSAGASGSCTLRATSRFYPAGELRLQVLGARGLEGPRALDQDCFATVALPSALQPYLFTTPVDARAGSAPVWEATFACRVVEHACADIAVFCRDPLSGEDEALGNVSVDLTNVYAEGSREAWAPLVRPAADGSGADAPAGMVHIRASFVPPLDPPFSRGAATAAGGAAVRFPQQLDVAGAAGYGGGAGAAGSGPASAGSASAGAGASPARRGVKAFELGSKSMRALEAASVAAGASGSAAAPSMGAPAAATAGRAGAAAGRSSAAGKGAAGDVEGGGSSGDGSAAVSASAPASAGAIVAVAGGGDLHEDDDDAGDFTEAEVEEAFDFLDLDHNRMVGFMEIKHLLACMGELVTDEEIDMMIRIADSDGKGLLNFFDVYAIAQHPNPAAPLFNAKRVGNKLRERMKSGQSSVSAARLGLAEESGRAGAGGVPTGSGASAAQGPPASLRTKSAVELQAEQRRRVEQKQAKQAACAAFASHHAVRLPQLKQVLERAESFVSFRRQDGFVNYGELCSLFDVPATSPEAAALFAAYVREGALGSVQAGRANMRELLLALCGFSATTAEQRVRFVFDLFDSDGSNTLSTAELIEVLKANHYSGDEAAARRKLAVVLRDSTRTGDVVDVNLSIGDFMALTKRFPNVFFPVVRVAGEAGGSGEPAITAEGAGALVSASTRFGPYGGAAAALMRGSSIRARPSSITTTASGSAGGLAAASGTGTAAAGAGAAAAFGSRAGVTGGAARGSITVATPVRTGTLPPISAVETPGDAVASPPAARRLLSSLFGASGKVAPSPQ